MKPIIAITVESSRESENLRTAGSMHLNWNYAQLVAEAGGLPIVVPPVADMSEIARLADGWLIPGGDDLPSSLWNEPLHPEAQVQDGSRFRAEKALFDALDPDVPVLGICYGCQVLNVLRGGSLVQHLPDVLGHNEHATGRHELYRIDGGSLLERETGNNAILGASYHHQAVGRVGAGLRVVARAEDGTIEGLESTDRPWMVGVQWHPERTPEDPATSNLFRHFIAAAAAYQRSRSEPVGTL